MIVAEITPRCSNYLSKNLAQLKLPPDIIETSHKKAEAYVPRFFGNKPIEARIIYATKKDLDEDGRIEKNFVYEAIGWIDHIPDPAHAVAFINIEKFAEMLQKYPRILKIPDAAGLAFSSIIVHTAVHLHDVSDTLREIAKNGKNALLPFCDVVEARATRVQELILLEGLTEVFDAQAAQKLVDAHLKAVFGNFYAYCKGSKFMKKIEEAFGVDTAWKRILQQIPTPDEIQNPASYLKRFGMA